MKNFDYKKSLGQNFLIDKNIINKIVSSIKSTNKDLIIEIGPGSGALTKELVKKESDLICFEIDKRLKDELLLINSNNLKIIFEDFMKINIKDYIDKNKYNKIYFVGNLPYYITTAIINKICDESDPEEITIMIQKEVADRFTAKPKSKSYSSISVFLQYNFNIIKLCDVSKNSFIPIPKVDSAVIKLKKRKKENLNNINHFYKLIKDSFQFKRKNLRNNLRNYDLEQINKTLFKYGKSFTSRAEELTLEEFIDISNSLN
ncbi:MAG: ribosomal RNA small subunit methyltransferase A [Tenericutes bacterium]|nr:ribosomal RNA small subunit methyltransferase A [Mycoplasmatota bacterium]